MKDFLTEERGISEATLEAFKVTTEGTKAFFPSYSRDGSDILFEKERSLEPEGGRKYRTVKGSKPALFGLHTLGTDAEYCFLVEGETDTMRLWQELSKETGESNAHVVGLPGIESWKPEWERHFDGIDKVYVVLDNDPDYAVQARVDKCWSNVRDTLGSRAKRIRIPDSVKDLCEFFDRYPLGSFNKLVEKAAKGILHFKALDLSIDPPPYPWLVEGFICEGDMSIMIGEPGIGKSVLAMDLAVAIAEEDRTAWLGHKLLGHGRVIYFDEENPEDVVRNRLKRIGLEEHDNIRYILNQGIRVDRPLDREKILEEAESFKPTLIVFDSLTRFHTGDENNSGFINQLFGDCFKPLARDTGATLLVLHHVNKSEYGSSFVRSRGSGDLSASIDSGFDVDALDELGQQLRIRQYKSRRGAAGDVVFARIEDRRDGGLGVDVIPVVL